MRERLNEQDKLIFDICFETGFRISDVLKIKKRDIGETIKLRESKTKKYKEVKISENLYNRLKPYSGNSDIFIFKSPRSPDKHLHRTTYHRHIKNACRGSSVDCSAHSTRKLYAWNIFKETRNIFDVQRALNHKYITTTAAYLDIDLVSLIQVTLQHNLQNEN